MLRQPLFAIAVAIVASTAIASVSWSIVKLSHRTTIDVRGSAKKTITSDLAEWTSTVTVTKPKRADAYAALKEDVASVSAYLAANKIPLDAIRISAISLEEQSHDDVVEEGQRTRHTRIFDGFHGTQSVTVTSSDVPLIERLSRESTQLLEKGIDLSSDAPQYLYTRVADLKIEMLALASQDARQRAEAMLKAAGGGAKVGHVYGIDTGVVNINAANSTETSWEGNYDTSSIIKDMLTTVRVSFEVVN